MKKFLIALLFLILTVFLSTTALADSNNSGIVTIDTNWTGTLQQAVEATGITNATDVKELHITDSVTMTLTGTDIAYLNTMTSTLEVLNVAETITVGDVGDDFFRNTGSPDATMLKSIHFPATTFGESAFTVCSKLKSISLPNATTLGDYLLNNCNSLLSVSIPNAKTIGDSAFWDCSSLQSISLPKATSFSNYAFARCISLKSIHIPLVTSFGDNAFYDCQALTSISLPKVTSFGNDAFRDCLNLTSASLPYTISFGERSFMQCTTLTSVYLPNATTFGADAFYYCSAIPTISLPSATTINGTAFFKCLALKSIFIPSLDTTDNDTFNQCNSLELLDIRSSNNFSIGFHSNFNQYIRIAVGDTIPTFSCTGYTPSSYSSEILVPAGMESSYDTDDGAVDGTWNGFIIKTRCDITYNGNDNTKGTPPRDILSPYANGQTITILNKNNLSRHGHTFNGWSLSPNSSSGDISCDSTYTINEDTILYAAWKIENPETGYYN